MTAEYSLILRRLRRRVVACYSIQSSLKGGQMWHMIFPNRNLVKQLGDQTLPLDDLQVNDCEYHSALKTQSLIKLYYLDILPDSCLHSYDLWYLSEFVTHTLMEVWVSRSVMTHFARHDLRMVLLYRPQTHHLCFIKHALFMCDWASCWCGLICGRKVLNIM